MDETGADIQDGMEEATRFAEQAIARMAAEQIPPTPENFSVWYAHYSGRAPDLSRTIEILASNRQAFTEDRAAELYDRFIGTRRETDAVRAAGQSVQTLLDNLLALLESHGDGTDRYGAALESLRGSLDKALGAEQLRTLIGLIAVETRKMVEQNQTLQTQLSSSSEQLAELRRNLDNVRKEASTDALTGLFNRKHFDAELRRAAAQAMEVGAPLALLMVDIDHFKRFNDTYGHTVGDQVLALVAQTLSDCVRGQDVAARYGGEEFAIILPETTLGSASSVAERIRETVSKRQIVNRSRNQSLGGITLSAGVAEYDPGESLATFIHRADAALYSAKRQGRNRVVATANEGAS